MFKRKYTKWIPLAIHTWASTTDYIVFARRNLKNGMIQFKTKRVLPWWALRGTFVPRELLDIKKQWELLLTVEVLTESDYEKWKNNHH